MKCRLVKEKEKQKLNLDFCVYYYFNKKPQLLQKLLFFSFLNNFMNANLILIVVVAAFSSLISAASVWDLHLFDTVGLRDEMHCNARKHKQIEKQKKCCIKTQVKWFRGDNNVVEQLCKWQKTGTCEGAERVNEKKPGICLCCEGEKDADNVFSKSEIHMFVDLLLFSACSGFGLSGPP